MKNHKIKAELSQLSELLENDLSKEQIKVMFSEYAHRIIGIKEKPELEVGKYYKGIDCCGSSFIFCVTGTDEDGDYEGYGIDGEGDWYYSGSWCSAGDPIKTATDKEVEEALTKEAFKRGFKEGVEFKSPKLGYKYRCESNRFYYSRHGLFSSNDTGGYLIFSNEAGKWAEIIKEEKPTKEELLNQIEALKEKINLL